MLNIGNKTFMNLQEAVGWLLENNALPFQSTANYVANTEIAMSTLVNPSPAKVRVGSLIFFADSKVSTVVGVTSNSFIVSDQYNDLVDDVVYVSNVAINASGHLIVSLSNGTDIDAGLIKQVSNFSIDASQHLIANYNDGTSTDLGAIFSGNINISGTLNATNVTGNSIVENMVGYSFNEGSSTAKTLNYAGVVKNGNKITFVAAFELFSDSEISSYTSIVLGRFTIPSAVGQKLFSNSLGYLDIRAGITYKTTTSTKNILLLAEKISNTEIRLQLNTLASTIPANERYVGRYELTFLLSDNLAS